MTVVDKWIDRWRGVARDQRTDDLRRIYHADPDLAARSEQRLRTFDMAEAVEPSIEGYRFLKVLGIGGMSVVWLAERTDGVVNRRVALKVPKFQGTSVDKQRFEQERNFLAVLKHPNIAHVYHAGFFGKEPFIELEYVEGVPITEYCDTHHLGLEQRLALYLHVLHAVKHAHACLIVHRDLKPSNVLVDAQGQVKLLDFGIAKLLTDTAMESVVAPAPVAPRNDLTLEGRLVATPMYAAPEQLLAAPISPLTDIYVLGILLYELLSGVHPHSRRSLAEIAQHIVEGEVPPPSSAALTKAAAEQRGLPSVRRLTAALKGDLDCIVLKALKKDPAARYQSAAQFAEDIERHRALRPLAAREPSLNYWAGLFLRRNRAASFVAVAGLGAALAIGAVALRQYQHARINDARAVAIRNFIFDLVNDAEPSEAHDTDEVTGKQMVDAAVRRARIEFAAQPRLRGELLGELGRMYGRLGSAESEKSLLLEALALLDANAPANDPALNKTRAHVAELALAEDDIERARELAALARSSCTRQDAECAKARAYGCLTLAKIALRDGRTDAAVAEMRNSVAEMERGFGLRHSETALAHANFAVMARNAGQLQEASAAIGRALEISERQTLKLADRRMILQTVAVLDIDLGRYRAASERLENLLEQAATPAERALQARLLANALLLQGRANDAVAAADRAIEAATLSGENTEALFARQARARALALQGRYELALNEIEAVVAGLLKTGRTASSPSVVRARRAQGEILARAGRWSESYEKLQEVASIEVEQGESLDLLGCAALGLDRRQEALSLHRRARPLLENKLPPDHPALRRNALYLEAAAMTGGSASACMDNF